MKNKKIVPKYQPDDTVYFLRDGKIRSGRVANVYFTYMIDDPLEVCQQQSSGYNLFKSKAELLKSLE